MDQMSELYLSYGYVEDSIEEFESAFRNRFHLLREHFVYTFCKYIERATQEMGWCRL